MAEVEEATKPEDAPKVDEALKPGTNTDRLLSESMARTNALIEKSIERTDRIEAERQKAEAPLRERLMKDFDKPMPDDPDIKKVPPPPKQNIAQELQDFVGSAMVVGAIGSLAGRAGATNALNAFAGAMEGYKQNRKEDFEARYKEWQAAVESIKDNNNAEIQRYKAVFENRKLGIEEKNEQLKLIASEFQNQAMFEATRTNNLIHAAQVYQQLVVHTDTIKRAEENMEMRRADQKRREAQEQRRQAEFEQKQAGLFDDETARTRAKRWMANDPTALQNLGRLSVGMANMAKIEQAISSEIAAAGLTPEQAVEKRRLLAAQSAGLRTSYQTEVKIGGAIEEVRSTIPAAEAAIDNYWGATNNRGLSALKWNQAKNFFDEQQQSPQLGQLAIALNAVVSPYGAAMARGSAGAEGTRAEARSLLSKEMSPEAAKARLRMMGWEMDNALRGQQQAREHMLHGAPADPGPPPLVPRAGAERPAGGPGVPVPPDKRITGSAPTEIPVGKTLTRPDGTFMWNGTEWIKQ